MSDIEERLAEFLWAIGSYLAEAGWEIVDEDDGQMTVSDPRSHVFDAGPIRVSLTATNTEEQS